jgi:hypothetical protein
MDRITGAKIFDSDQSDKRGIIRERLEKMSSEVIASIVGRTHILEALSVVGI